MEPIDDFRIVAGVTTSLFPDIIPMYPFGEYRPGTVKTVADIVKWWSWEVDSVMADETIETLGVVLETEEMGSLAAQMKSGRIVPLAHPVFRGLPVEPDYPRGRAKWTTKGSERAIRRREHGNSFILNPDGRRWWLKARKHVEPPAEKIDDVRPTKQCKQRELRSVINESQ